MYCDEFNFKSLEILKTKINAAPIVFFGASKLGTIALEEFKKIKLQMDFFCDNDSKKWGEEFNGIKIISVKELYEMPINTNVIITSSYTEEICDQISKLNKFNIFSLKTLEVLSEDGREYRLIEYYNFNENQKLLGKNLVYKNSGINKRAFLLATGPSIKLEDLKKLEGEDCYSVSNFFLHKDLEVISPKIHFFAPYHKPLILENYIEWLEISDSKLPKSTNICLEISNRRFIEDFKIFKDRKVNYVRFTDNPSKKEVDLTLDMLGPQTSPIMVLGMLIYMGYEKIYLLGCDHTVLRDYGKVTKNFYEKNEDMRKNSTDSKAWFGIIEYLEATKKMFLQYKFYKEMIENKGISIVNLSRDSWLDLFPFDVLDNVIKR
ncbi:hypothetical protein KYB31_02205 [Clostridium felsineum]|uniref:hypothetical protein n=1 Tax=Clostridium felsineum TaxID=36839 RepID=UPI00214D4AE2|nr:hypothetical protein [Clostridium felsineum]MCR3757808.1 hypothetical protein [Clostridium felsineum]